MSRYYHRTIDGVRVSIDVDYNVCVVDDTGMGILVLGKARPAKPGEATPYKGRWMAEPYSEIRVDKLFHRTQGEAISALLAHTAWV